jgi:hypothetical protein
MRLRNTSRHPGEETHDAHFMGAAVEEVVGAPGYLVALDGGQIALEV